MTINPEHPTQETQELISDQEALDFLEASISNWDFSGSSVEENSWFAINVAHWALEAFGQQRNDGNWFLFMDSGHFDEYHDGFDGQELPERLRQLVLSVWKDELVVGNNNSVQMRTKHDYVEDDITIPEWDRMTEEIKAFEDIIDYIKDHPEIIEGISVPLVGVIPQVELVYRPDSFYEWGLEFNINKLGVGVSPFGSKGKTRKPADFVVDLADKTSEAAEIACKLSLLGACYSRRHSYDCLPASMLDTFSNRMFREERIPLILADYQGKPGNSMKRLIIERLMEDGAIEL